MLYTENNPHMGYDGYYNRSRSSGVAKAGLATGTTGAVLGGLSFLGNMLGGNGVLGAPQCSENMPINRYETQLMHENMMLKAEAEHGKISSETDRKILELYKFVNDELNGIKAQACDQRVINQHTSDMTDSLMASLRSQKDEMYRLIHNEADERNRGDAQAVDYANCTFVPQTICGVKCDPDLAYVKALRNPFSCNNGCGCSK